MAAGEVRGATTGRRLRGMVLVGALALAVSGACSGSAGSDLEGASGEEPLRFVTTTTGDEERSPTAAEDAPETPSSDSAAGAAETSAGSDPEPSNGEEPQGEASQVEGRDGDGQAVDAEDDEKPPLPTTVTLAKDCVRPGGTQNITISTGKERSAVVYNTIYADGNSGIHEDHYGGNNGGYTDEDGSWSDTWVIDPAAPAGEAKVRVRSVHDGHFGSETVYFQVASTLGRC